MLKEFALYQVNRICHTSDVSGPQARVDSFFYTVEDQKGKPDDSPVISIVTDMESDLQTVGNTHSLANVENILGDCVPL